MDIDFGIFSVVHIINLSANIIFALIYMIPILFIRRFHQHNNILTLNVCLASICCCLSWLPFRALPFMEYPLDFIQSTGIYLYITQTIFTIQVPFSFVATSIHRYCSIVYHTKSFFRTKRWIILCIGCQWLFAFILIIPNLVCIKLPCGRSLWLSISYFVGTIIVSSMMCLIINVLIYHYVRASSRRVQPQAISEHIQQTKISRRDIYLLRHMILMFCVFVGGWAPVFIIPIISHYIPIRPIVSSSITVICEVALLIDIIDLFLYNHELTKYLKYLCVQFFH
ncbi:unnamed protein product [Adineta steineri]|uniref:G-protein coupled receptors family 1 profile domain-containing protein n=1 Tax=Adineta steineri TaxID=433720 RepID=A0A816CLG7_9BILA|nr:unnamed protein product [Adineta steineri]CAF1624928.1 unnamed protein product [Adineta steineri]